MASTYTYQVKRKLQLQRSALISNLTAAELVRTYAALYEVYLDRRQIMALLAQVQLTEQANALARQMSGGQQQRLALAMANDPQVALLDRAARPGRPLRDLGYCARLLPARSHCVDHHP